MGSTYTHARSAAGAALASVMLLFAFGPLGGCAGTNAEHDGANEPRIAVSEGWTEIGTSVKGRPIEAITIGTGPGRVLVIGGIHGDEREAIPSISRLVKRLGAGEAGAAATWCVVRDLNPDGTSLARRANARQVDLNRNFPARNFVKRERHGPTPLSEPETAALVRLVEARPPTMIVVFHSSSYGPFVNFDGPGEGAAQAFATGAARSDPRWRLVPDMSYSTPGSLGSYFGVDQKVPVLTIEFARGQEPLDAWLAIEGGFGALAEHLVANAAQASGTP